MKNNDDAGEGQPTMPKIDIFGNRKPCKPATQFWHLATNGLFANYQYDPLRRTDCQSVHCRFLADLCIQGMGQGWWLVNGLVCMRVGRILHTWLECDGWGIDLSNGNCWFFPRDVYRENPSATHVKKIASSQFARLAFDGDPALDRFLYGNAKLASVDKVLQAEVLAEMRKQGLHVHLLDQVQIPTVTAETVVPLPVVQE